MKTPQEALRDAMPAILAAADGKKIQVRYPCSSDWEETTLCYDTKFANPNLCWRPTPEPKRRLRPWRECEVPVGAIIRDRKYPHSGRLLIVFSKEKGLAGRDTNMPYHVLRDDYEYSTDGGATWSCCGVWEEQP